MMGETEKPLKTYEVREEAGRLLAVVDEELLYDFEEDDMDDDFSAKLTGPKAGWPHRELGILKP
jgi:toluene monooxygenase system ferredoxin subunit